MYNVNYKCYKCKHEWSDIHECAHDDDCPECGSSDNTPLDYDLNLEVLEEVLSRKFHYVHSHISEDEIWIDGNISKLDKNRSLVMHTQKLYPEAIEILTEFCEIHFVQWIYCSSGNSIRICYF